MFCSSLFHTAALFGAKVALYALYFANSSLLSAEQREKRTLLVLLVHLLQFLVVLRANANRVPQIIKRELHEMMLLLG